MARVGMGVGKGAWDTHVAEVDGSMSLTEACMGARMRSLVHIPAPACYFEAVLRRIPCWPRGQHLIFHT